MMTNEERTTALYEKMVAEQHCRECICQSCDLLGTDSCLEGAAMCAKCDCTEHTGYCPWHPDEQ